jgi:uncharacterized membrane protein
MNPSPDLDDARGTPTRAELTETVRQAFITGATLTIPGIITLIILTVVLNFVSNLVPDGVVEVANSVWPGQALPAAVVEGITILALVALILAVGFVAERTAGDAHAERFHGWMESIPGLGSVYTSFNEMSELLLDSDTDSFQEVKLVEYPTEGSYVVAFLTASMPEDIESATGNEEMVTLFVPMAPNPVMGGFVIHVDADRVVDVDMSVEEGIRSIVTSGVATGEGGPQAAGVGERELRELGATERIGQQVDPGRDRLGAVTAPPRERARAAAYDEQVDPEHAGTPEGVEQRRKTEREDRGEEDLTPRELESRGGEQ